MRILMDYEFNRDAETYNGVRAMDVEEFERLALTPEWNKDSPIDGVPDSLYIVLQRHADGESDSDTVGKYMLDGTRETFDRAIFNYSRIVNKLLVNGYAQISDFENVDWA